MRAGALLIIKLLPRRVFKCATLVHENLYTDRRATSGKFNAISTFVCCFFFTYILRLQNSEKHKVLVGRKSWLDSKVYECISCCCGSQFFLGGCFWNKSYLKTNFFHNFKLNLFMFLMFWFDEKFNLFVK